MQFSCQHYCTYIAYDVLSLHSKKKTICAPVQVTLLRFFLAYSAVIVKPKKHQPI